MIEFVQAVEIKGEWHTRRTSIPFERIHRAVEYSDTVTRLEFIDGSHIFVVGGFGAVHYSLLEFRIMHP